MTRTRAHREYLCDVCSARIGKRGRVLIVRGFVTDAFCRAHRRAASFGRFDR